MIKCASQYQYDLVISVSAVFTEALLHLIASDRRGRVSYPLLPF